MRCPISDGKGVELVAQIPGNQTRLSARPRKASESYTNAQSLRADICVTQQASNVSLIVRLIYGAPTFVVHWDLATSFFR